MIFTVEYRFALQSQSEGRSAKINVTSAPPSIVTPRLRL